MVDVIRGDASLRRNLQGVSLKIGDRVVLRTQIAELLSLQRDKNLKRVDQVSAVETTTVEVLITPGCKMVGRSLGQMRLRRRFGVYPLAVHRRNQNIGRQLDDLVVQVGDTLLLEGAREDIQRLPKRWSLWMYPDLQPGPIGVVTRQWQSARFLALSDWQHWGWRRYSCLVFWLSLRC